MELIKTTQVMENELNNYEEFSTEMVTYLTYTRRYYLLEKDGVKEITSKKVTLVQLQMRMDLTEYTAYVLEDEEAIKALGKVAGPAKKETTPKPAPKKAPAPKAVKKEEPKKEVKAKGKKKSGK